MMIQSIAVCLAAIALIAQPAADDNKNKDAECLALNTSINRTSWGNNRLPADCPLTLSDSFSGISFTGRYATYTSADTWYPVYATDGSIYSCCTDGKVNGVGFGSPNPGAARIFGDSPLALSFEPLPYPAGHGGADSPKGKYKFGRYPSSDLMYNDIWYYGTYMLEQNDRSTYVPNIDWPILQPFIGFRTSTDFGKSWVDKTEPSSPLFENPHEKWIGDHNVEYNAFEVMIGAPHFVDFGLNMKYAPADRKTGRKWAYMVAHGADPESTVSHNSWISGDNVYLLRILMPEGTDAEKNVDWLNDASNWEYLAKNGRYRKWNRDNLDEVRANIKPLVDATGYLGNVGLTWNPGLKKYIMTLSRVSSHQGAFNAIILESDTIDGEYKVVQYLKEFATVAYFMNVPSCFISEDGKTMWLCYSANYMPTYGPKKSTIGGATYGMCLTEFTIERKGTDGAGKYEAEGMALLGTSAREELSAASNGAIVNKVSCLGDGLEFYTKNSGNCISITVSRDGGPDDKRISVYVNDELRGKLTVTPTGSEDRFASFSLPTKIGYGDKITLRIDMEDLDYNRRSGCRRPDGSPVTDTSYKLFGNVDYVTITE